MAIPETIYVALAWRQIEGVEQVRVIVVSDLQTTAELAAFEYESKYAGATNVVGVFKNVVGDYAAFKITE